MPLDFNRIHDVPDDLLAAIDYCYEQGWTDGLPVIPPVLERVHAMLAYEGRPPEAVIATHPATGLQLTVHAAAVNSVMAGCLPEYFPVVVAAFEATADSLPVNVRLGHDARQAFARAVFGARAGSAAARSHSSAPCSSRDPN